MTERRSGEGRRSEDEGRRMEDTGRWIRQPGNGMRFQITRAGDDCASGVRVDLSTAKLVIGLLTAVLAAIGAIVGGILFATEPQMRSIATEEAGVVEERVEQKLQRHEADVVKTLDRIEGGIQRQGERVEFLYRREMTRDGG